MQIHAYQARVVQIFITLLCLLSFGNSLAPSVGRGWSAATLSTDSTRFPTRDRLLVVVDSNGRSPGSMDLSKMDIQLRVKVNGSEGEMPSFFMRLRRYATSPWRKLRRIFRRRREELQTPIPLETVTTSADAQQVQTAASPSETEVDQVQVTAFEPETVNVTAATINVTATEVTVNIVTDPVAEELPPPVSPIPFEGRREPVVLPERSATASVDLTGTWDLIVTDDFKVQYDKYLTMLGQPFLVRSVAVNIVGLTSEETIQENDGRNLLIRGRNARGVWERTLIASAPESGNYHEKNGFEPVLAPITTADDENVLAEAWWEENGTVHRSWLRGVEKYGGGSFESKRYLENNGKTLVCESVFHPDDQSREKPTVTWRFQKRDT